MDARMHIRSFLAALAIAAIVGTQGSFAATVEEALSFVPKQSDVEYDRPTREQIAECSIDSEKIGNASAWVVRGPAGQVLRAFLDLNGDNRVDQWRYFANGTESYRDCDTNFNGNADEYRWVGLSGRRVGIDENEDGRIDRWSSISPEEVTFEVFAAVRDRDPERFQRVLITPQELDALSLGNDHKARIQQLAATADGRFRQLIKQQKVIDAKAQWVHFGAIRPGIIPAGTDGSSRDVIIYENVAAMIDLGKEPGQIGVGTLVQVGDVWKVIDIPSGLVAEDAEPPTTLFLSSLNRSQSQQQQQPENALSAEMQKLVTDLNNADQAVRQAKDPKQRADAYQAMARVLRKLASVSKKDDQLVWMRQLADTLSQAAQSGEYPEGIADLKQLHGELASQAKDAEITGYVLFRLMLAEYSLALKDAQGADDFQKIQEDWLQKLNDFVQSYPKSEDAAEAMWQLAIAEEFAGNEKEALSWYDKIVANKTEPVALVHRKADGARRRLNSVGQAITLRGNTTIGKQFDLQQAKGRVVPVYFWATWSESCVNDIKRLQQLCEKYGPDKFLPVGVNLDQDVETANRFLQEKKVNWPNFFQTGGLDSSLAVQFGISSVPTMILIDPDGKVINHNVSMVDLEEYLDKKLR